MPVLQSQQDIERGRETLTYFHNSSVGKAGYNFRSETELENYLGGSNVLTFLDAFGFQINTLLAGGVYDMADVREAMQSLARISAGKVPTQGSFFQSIVSITQGGPSVLSSISFTTKETVKQVAAGAQVVGNAVIKTGSSLFGILPFLAVAGVVGYVYLFVKRRA